MFLHTLDDTSWSIADIIGPIGTGTHNFFINFTANETEYASIHFVGDANSGHVYYDDTLVASYPLTVWEDAAYQQVAIAGGIDATNPTLLAWFKQYAKNATPSGGDTDIVSALNDIAAAISGGGGGSDLPAIESGDAGKVLTVNEGETGTEWATPGGGDGIQQLRAGSGGNVLFCMQGSDPPMGYWQPAVHLLVFDEQYLGVNKVLACSSATLSTVKADTNLAGYLPIARVRNLAENEIKYFYPSRVTTADLYFYDSVNNTEYVAVEQVYNDVTYIVLQPVGSDADE